MKRKARWSGIWGGIVTVLFLLLAVGQIAQPADFLRETIANIFSDLLWVALGIYLLAVYLKSKKQEDVEQLSIKPEANTPEDKEQLSKTRNRVLGILLAIEIIISSSAWILNNYAAGLTPVNVFIIFDLFANLVLAYLVVELLRNKRNVLTLLLCVVILIALVEGGIDLFWRHEVWDAVSQVITSAYFVYLIKMPLTRQNVRIAYLIVLPLVIVLFVACALIGNARYDTQNKSESLIEQQYSSDTDNINNSYTPFTNKDVPSITDIQNTQAAIAMRNSKLQELLVSLNTIRAQDEKELPSVDQIKRIQNIDDFVIILNLEKQQTDVITKLMNYVQNLDLNSLSNEQKTQMTSLEQQVQSYNDQITAAQFKQNNIK